MNPENTSTVKFYDSLWSRTRRMDQHHKCRIHVIDKLMRLTPPPRGQKRKILELGCGSGMISSYLATYGNLVGVDQSVVGIETARSRVAGKFVVGTLPEIPVPENDFDLCVLSQVLEHFEASDQTALLRQAREKLAPGGHLIVTTPNRPVSERMSFRDGELQPIENWLDPDSLVALLEGAGWKVKETLFAFNFFPILASRHAAVRGARFILYDLLRLRPSIEDYFDQRRTGDTTAILAVKV
jgi:SAM-dependent methyltransferase